MTKTFIKSEQWSAHCTDTQKKHGLSLTIHVSLQFIVAGRCFFLLQYNAKWPKLLQLLMRGLNIAFFPLLNPFSCSVMNKICLNQNFYNIRAMECTLHWHTATTRVTSHHSRQPSVHISRQVFRFLILQCNAKWPKLQNSKQCTALTQIHCVTFHPSCQKSQLIPPVRCCSLRVTLPAVVRIIATDYRDPC